MTQDRFPTTDAQDQSDPNDLHRRIVIPTEPGESIEVKYITDLSGVVWPLDYITDNTGIMPMDSL